MTASSLPYHLRPHKAVDRRLFVDLLGRCKRWRSLADTAYISMSAYPLEDHKLVHRTLGLRKLVAFDRDEEIVKRQIFNRPVAGCKCVRRSSGEIVAGLDTLLADVGYADCHNVIVWLDYTSPAELSEQIREFETLLDKLTEGDIVRVTVNANAGALYTVRPQTGIPTPSAAAIKQLRFDKLEDRIGDYLPADAVPGDMTDDDLPPILSRSFGKAVMNAFPTSGHLTFVPLSIVRYADGQQMLSMTGMVVRRTEEGDMRNRLGLADWRFASSSWGDVHRLAVPDLTLRERLLLEREIGTTSTAELKHKLGFDFSSLEVGDRFLDDYEHYYRFYPNLLAAEL